MNVTRLKSNPLSEVLYALRTELNYSDLLNV